MPSKTVLHIICAAFIALMRTADASTDVTLNFSTNNNYLTCNGTDYSESPHTCTFDDNNKIDVRLKSWGGHSSVLTLTHTNPDTVTISGDCVQSWIEDLTKNLNYNLNPDCLPRPLEPPPRAHGETLLNEWFADLPWHQKLSTKDSNLIDVPFVLPSAAITRCQGIFGSPEKERCMLRYGIVNVMAMHRTDKLYLPDDVAPDGQDCSDGKCVEVKIEVERVHTNTDNARGYTRDPVTNNKYDYYDGEIEFHIPSLGFAITEATIFAPWRPWYMGHYCAVTADNISDSVCYEDYFTTQLIAATNLEANEKWLIDHPVLFYPQTRGIQFGHFCQTTPPDKADNPEPCPMFLGKVKFNDNLTTPQIDGCPGGSNECLIQVNTKTQALDDQFKQSLEEFADIYRYPWEGSKDAAAFKPATAYVTNPFIGYYGMTENRTEGPIDHPTYLFKATSYALPKLCTKQDFANARLKGDLAAIQHLKDCSLNFEIHTNGFYEVWKDLYGGNIDEEAIKEIHKVFNGALDTNQYGRTMFMYAGVPEQMIPISFVADIPADIPGGRPQIHTHEKIYGSSLYTQYLPMVNPDDQTQITKEYTDDFWHAIFMSNHMNQNPDHFIRGIRGRTLWHNEYRSNLMYKAEEIGKTTGDTHFGDGTLAHLDFPAGFQKANHTSLYHGNTCDSCHIRNGSGVPLMPNGELPELQVGHGMNKDYHLVPALLDYTHTNPSIPAMKLVLFDLKDGGGQCDDSDHTIVEKFYRNRYMNFYGNSFHVNQSSGEKPKPTYVMEYTDVNPSEGFFLVDTTTRKSADNTVYAPKRLHITSMDTGNDRCSELSTRPANVPAEEWPENCAEVDGTHLGQAIDKGEIGVMQLLGKRLGNTPLIEMIPDETIKENHRSQQKTINHAGCYGLVAGTRAGASGDPNYRWCTTPRLGPDAGCYLSRWGWIGDRASLEDQIANAAHVEMNISSKQGFTKINSVHQGPHQLVRYNKTFCGPADLSCQEKKPNSDITEEEIRNMATYQRWIGIPQRSEYQVTSAPVQRGEGYFRNLGCSTCHVIDKIKFVASDNMLPDEERAALEKLQDETGDVSDYPFVSYLGTDLLLHDMGYLSQVARAPVNEHNFRNPNGTINNRYTGYIQKIRTPPLKGLRFNRFVTDSNHNTTDPIRKITPPDTGIVIPGCDFLLHDGRACDVIEAAYLHDGPAVKKLNMINRLNSLTTQQLTDLRAFLYSL